MRKGLKYSALSGVVLLLAVSPLFAQKVTTTFDKANDFTRYKRYAIGKNYLLTHQTADIQANIHKVLADSLNRQLQAKGFILDQDHPDFTIKFEAGAVDKADAGGQPDMLYGVPVGPAFGVVGIEGIPPAVWTYALAKLRLTVTDVGTGQTVWTGLASEKMDPQKDLNNIDQKIDSVMAKTLKSFPPGSKSK